MLFGFAGLVVLITASGHRGRRDDRRLPDHRVRDGLLVVRLVVDAALPLPKDPFVLTVYEMLFGAVWLFVIAAVRASTCCRGRLRSTAWLAWAYLVTFGSVVAFTSYVWVLSVAPISLVATYAYVNPVVAVFLGWLILSEPITLAIVVGGGVVVASVALVIARGATCGRYPRPASAVSRPPTSPSAAVGSAEPTADAELVDPLALGARGRARRARSRRS